MAQAVRCTAVPERGSVGRLDKVRRQEFIFLVELGPSTSKSTLLSPIDLLGGDRRALFPIPSSVQDEDEVSNVVVSAPVISYDDIIVAKVACC